jgi:TrwC relaxase
MTRILRPGGKLILVGHVASSSRVARDVQRALEVITVPMASEHFLRRPLANVTQREFSIERAERFELGLIAHEFTDNSVHGFDLTFAAPKSVSLIRALTDDTPGPSTPRWSTYENTPAIPGCITASPATETCPDFYQTS